MKIISVAFVASVLYVHSVSSAIPPQDAIRAIVGEAAGEGRTGMLAVAAAIRNRGTLKGVYGLRSKMPDTQPAYVWQRARIAWAQSETNDITRGATHFENIKAFGHPRWSSSLTVTTNIGNHTFYKLKRTNNNSTQSSPAATPHSHCSSFKPSRFPAESSAHGIESCSGSLSTLTARGAKPEPTAHRSRSSTDHAPVKSATACARAATLISKTN